MADQVQRLFYMYKKFHSGQKYTTAELLDVVRQEFGNISLRTIQRDMLILQECEPAFTSKKVGKEYVWYIPREARNMNAIVKLDSNELLSFYILKAHLKTFSGTVIQEDVERLANKIEKIAPFDVFDEQSMYWDQNIGQFDYTQFDPIIRKLIKSITEQIWIQVSYDSLSKGSEKEIIIMPRRMFSYAGSLYVVAYVPKHSSHVAMAIQNFSSINYMDKYKAELPNFDFLEWTKYRFGVFWGEPKKVMFEVKKEFAHYFRNRKWHSTQKLTEEDNGTLVIEMKVPLSTDFIAWLLSWNHAIVVLKPAELIKSMHETLLNTLRQYDPNF